MQFAGIIAEYDPFHSGHAWQLAEARRMGAVHIAVAMSCGLTQRGEISLLPESVRAHAAVLCGADLVFALPAPCACSGAEAFANAGVRLLAAAGCDALVFGAEDADAERLLAAAAVLRSEAYRSALKARLAAGARSFAAARQQAVADVAPRPDLAALLDRPNNNLAVEYCKAILALRDEGIELTPCPLPRQGADHGAALAPGAAYASASALRRLWAEHGPEALAPYVPAEVLPLYREAYAAGQDADFAAAGRCQLALLRAACGQSEPFAQTRGVSEGLDHRLEAAVRAACTRDGLVDDLTTVRYPRARMRRLAMDAALGYTRDLPAVSPYLHVLAARRAALPLLKGARLPASHSLARLRSADAACAQMAAAQLAASDFAALCRQKPGPMGGILCQKNIFLP